MQEHVRVRDMLNQIEQEMTTDFNKAKQDFSKVKWNLEKHFFMEEKATFELYSKMKNEEIEDIFKLMREHGEIVELIRNIEQGLINNVKPDISGLKDSLLAHANFEDEFFYPKLDEELTPEQRQEICDRAREIIM